jgi:hypothetical protein
VADELGTAVLRLELDTSGLKEGLAKAKQQVEQELGTATTATSRTRRTTPSSSAGVTGPGGGVDERDLVRRFNLRGVVRTLETFSNEISQLESGRTLNIGSSWTKALAILQEVDTDLKQVSAGQQLNLNTSWTTALQTLQEVDTDLKQVAAGERLNLNNSWTTALQTLQEVDTDLKQVAAGEKLNLNRSWNTALRQLAEIDTDLRNIAGGKRLNLDASWNTALRQLNEIDTDLRTIASGKRLNLRASWNKFFDDAEQVRRDIRTSGEAARKRSRADTQKRTKDVAANALIGVGFPLLFGQGVGAAAGGGVGGALGALGGGTFGFAGSIVGTALGAAFDTALQKAQTLAQGLENPIKNFGALQEAALLSSRSLEKQAEALIASGRSGEAYALIQEDLAETFGTATAANEYRDAVDELNREWAKGSTALASFTAGPLADFLKRLRLATGGTPATPEERAVRSQQQVDIAKALLAFGPQIAAVGGAAAVTGVGTAPGLLGLGIGAGVTALGVGLAGEINSPQTYQEIEASIAGAVEAATRLRKEREKDLKIQELSLRATIESTRGNSLTALEIQKQRLEREKIRELEINVNAPEAEQDRIKAQFNEQIAVTNEQILQGQQKIALETFKEFQTREQISRSIGNTLQLLGTEQGQYRDTLGTIQQIGDTIDAARRKEAEIGFQIDQARVGGRDEEAARLVDQQRTAALETRQRFIEGALALTRAGEQLRDNLRNAVLEFTRIRSDAQGLNRFLSPGRQDRRERQDFQLLLPSFREAQGRFAQLTGTRAPEFRGTTRGVNETVRDFIATVDREFQARQTVGGAQQSLQKVNEALVGVNTQLSEATNRLAAKDWNVSVNVVNNADGSRTVNAINGLSS